MKIRETLLVIRDRLEGRRAILIAVAVLAAVAIGYVLFSPGGGGTSAESAAGGVVNGVVQDGSGRTVAYWFDPMVPGERYKAPGKSSMSMDLQPKYADEASAGGVRVSPEVQQNLGVRTTRAAFANLASAVAVVGRVETDERRITEVQTLTPGFVEQLTVRAVGEPVGRGRLIATVYSPDLYAAQVEFAALRNIRPSTITPGLRQAARERLRLLGLPSGALRRLDAGGAPQRTYAVTARQSGIVTAIGARPGAKVDPGQSIVTLADLSQVWIVADVPETSLGQIRVGQPVQMTFPAYPGEIRNGRVDYIFPTLEPQARTARVRVTLPNPNARLKIGMFANMTISGTGAGGLVVPADAVISTGKRNVVIVKRGGSFIPVEVVPGPTVRDMTVIQAGLQPNAEVVVSGQFLIDSEASLQGVIERLSAGQQSDPQHESIEGKGIVRSIDVAARRIVLTHEPVRNWPAMTMPFAVRDGGLLRGRKAGERVVFEFNPPQPGQAPVIVRIAPDAGR